MDNENKNLVFYGLGDIVILRHKELKNRQPMYIVEKCTRQYKQGDEIQNAFLGFKCRWLDKDGRLQEAIFSTKDLELYK